MKKLWCLGAMLWSAVAAAAIDYPALPTLRLLDAQLTLPENVERLKRAGAPHAEVSLVLANVLSWWDAGPADLAWLAPDKADQVKALERARLVQRRTWWRDRLTGEIAGTTADRERARVDGELRRNLQALLTPAEFAEYETRTSPAMAKVREWTWGLGVAEEKIAWLADVERERRAMRARTMSAGVHGPAAALDDEAGEIARLDTALLILDASTAATYIRRADADFLHWLDVFSGDDGLPPEKLLRVYVWRRRVRRAELQWDQDRSITRTQERAAMATLLAETRSKVQALLGEEAYRRFATHEIARWLDAP